MTRSGTPKRSVQLRKHPVVMMEEEGRYLVSSYSVSPVRTNLPSPFPSSIVRVDLPDFVTRSIE